MRRHLCACLGAFTLSLGASVFLPLDLPLLPAGAVLAMPGPLHDAGMDSGGIPSVAALRIEGELTADGVLDEAAWSQAPVASGFTQRLPDTGEPISQRTEFQVAFSETTLYVAVRAYDEEPEKIIAREMQRDGGLFRDDGVALLLDTFHDHRNAYFFETNPNGARTDSLVNDEGRNINFQWDGIWTVGSRRNADGWIAEYAIPLSTLRFDPSLDTWGLNVRRAIRRNFEFSFWAPISLEANVWRVSRFGHVTGLKGLKPPGLNLQIKPFATGMAGKKEGESFEDGEVGLDVKWGVTRNLNLDLTYNTDFAEVEADDLQVNLTRFSLFFPEKREFFLENSGIFAFGPGAPELDLFFSRRIGIGEEGEPVPVEWGARLTGRVGPWSVGVLDAETEEFTSEETGNTNPKTNWGVVRLKRNLGERSTVGMLLTEKAVSGDSEAGNRSFGLDLNWNPQDRLNVSAFLAQSDGGVDQPEDFDGEWAGGVEAEWRGSFWFWELGYQEIRDGFSPEMGFVRRRGIRRYESELFYNPRPENPKIRNYSYGLEVEAVTRLDDSLETLEVESRLFGLELQSADEIYLSADHTVEDLLEPFEIRDGIVIAPGRYTFTTANLRYDGNSSRRASMGASLGRGGFFDGNRTRGNISLRLRPNRFLRSETSWARNEIDLPAGSFNTDVVRQRLAVSFTPDLSLNTFIQYSDSAEVLALNVRFNWIYRPGADLFVVYNQAWDAPSGFGDLSARDRQVIVKFTYLFEF